MACTSKCQRLVFFVWFALAPGYSYASDQLGSMNVLLLWVMILLAVLALVLSLPVVWLTRRMSNPRTKAVLRILLPILSGLVLVAFGTAWVLGK